MWPIEEKRMKKMLKYKNIIAFWLAAAAIAALVAAMPGCAKQEKAEDEGMKEKVTVFCFTDIHNQQAMLDYPTTLRKSLLIAAEDAVNEFGKADLAIVGGDNISDYPDWNKSCALPKVNFEDLKMKLNLVVAGSTKTGKVLYVAGNNDMILGDIGTKDNKPYNTTDFYYAGPMITMLGKLDDSEKYEVMSVEKPWENPYLDAFHYVIDGIDFIGINIDPNTAFNTHNGYYTDETLDWVKAKIDEIDPEGTKPIFVVGHLSAQYYNTAGKWAEDMDFSREKFYDAFRGHKNLFYLYGHIHGENYVYDGYSSGAVIHIGENDHAIDANKRRDSSLEQPADFDYSLVHMGGLRPFGASHFEGDGLTGYGGYTYKQYYPSTANPKLAQYLVMEIYKDRVVFNIRNTGSELFYERDYKLKPYTVYFR